MKEQKQRRVGRPKSETVSRRPVQQEQYDQLMTYVDQIAKPKTAEKLRRAFTLLFFTGLRIGELVLISRADVISIIEKNIFSLSNATKTKKPRLVIVSKNGQQAIKEIFEMDWDENIDDMSLKVFHAQGNDHTKPLGVPGLNKLINLHMKESLGSLYTSHSFRQGLISDMLLKGVAVTIVSSYISHTALSTTLKYLRPTEENMIDAVNIAR